MSTHTDQNIATKLQSLLDRVASLKLARDVRKPTRFNARGQAHARRVAQQETQAQGIAR